MDIGPRQSATALASGCCPGGAKISPRNIPSSRAICRTGDVYVQTIEQSVLAAVNSRTSAVLGDWKMPEKNLGVKGRNLKGLNEIRRSRSEGLLQVLERLAPQVGLEPTTLRLTAECSAIELLRSVWRVGIAPAFLYQMGYG
jgi:hypothetical protein